MSGIEGLAVVGMAGRFPGARNVPTFWANLLAGTDQITRGPIDTNGRVHGYGVLPDADEFDASFFGFSPREALMLDPQHRVFLECAWEALENAGCDPTGHPGVIGVFGGCGITEHPAALREHRHRFPGSTPWEFHIASGPDFLTSRVAYKLDLRGPAVSIQTACATSLVAVHLAGQALLAGDCDLALAGGVTVHVPAPVEGEGDDGVLSADARCRSFDAAANGTVAGDGAGVVVLRRLEDVLADGDRVLAVIRGSAVTNDGAGKVGFLAPGVVGQAEAVRAAHLVADVDPATIEYVEAHGTGTEVGDPIEVRALTKAFALGTDATGFCRLNSVKSAIGHTDAAAGVIGLITAVLALRHGIIPGTRHFRGPHPDLMLERSPFVVSAEPLAWPSRDTPRRAAVNSLGLGGTNVHVVLEEAPVPARREPEYDGHHLLPVSARTVQALSAASRELSDHLHRSGDPLGDIAWTLQTGRRGFPQRAFVVAADRAAAARALSEDLTSGQATRDGRSVAFLFPGQGGQYLGMGEDLYRDEPVFRTAVDASADLAASQLGFDLRTVLYPVPGAETWAQTQLDTMRVCQPVLFAVQHALAQLWQARGVIPAAVLGHSLGAYAAAATAGVLTLADAMTLVLTRGRLLDGLPAGSMLAVPLVPGELEPLLTGDLVIGAINSPDQCVVTGPAEQVRALRELLESRGVDVRPLRISAAAHSTFVDAVLPEYAVAVAGVSPRPPVIPWISDRTGSVVTAQEAQDPTSWTAHLRQTVRFSDALATLLDMGDDALLEVGPGHTLSTLARRHPDCGPGRPLAQSLAAAGAPDRDGGAVSMLRAAGRLWASGVSIDWPALHRGRPRRKVELPAYPFQRSRFRLDEDSTDSAVAVAVEAPALSPVEKILATAFAHALGMPEVGVHDDFFDLGGDSLIASRILADVRAELGDGLTARAFFAAPTVSRLAALIDDPSGPAETARSPHWLLRRLRRPDAPLRMYCFPHSGGSPGEYLAWADSLPGVELFAVQPPGRGHRVAEPPYTSMQALVADFVAGVELVEPYVFFGHSLGALVAYETARALRDAGRPGPQRLYLSAFRAPHLHHPAGDLQHFADAELVDAVEAKYGALPPELTASPEMLELMLPVLRADLTIVANYRAQPAAPLSCAITVLGGSDDGERGDLLAAWRDYTTGPFETRIFPGGHFYFRERTHDFLRHLAGSQRASGVVRRTDTLGSADSVS
nr:type I polyketide synthase [Kibdelosporangium sp. MJ126-NF4]CEL23082.1 Malonyl CoA-acyl carrier protein transacylase [Kibdelosporangium sp. MJ126-NF4]CTQ90219.1 Malonyl CoA-acyl carrier protein transacylase (EC 2.3.1.39) [Kibdelosporangium sp. MJ126-NF4]